MNILLETAITDEIRDRYLLLELDSFRLSPDGDPLPAYCLLEPLPLDQTLIMQQYLDLHQNLILNYRRRNWNYVEQAIEHLMGQWNHQMDSFYSDLLKRVKALKMQDLDDTWDGIIQRYS